MEMKSNVGVFTTLCWDTYNPKLGYFILDVGVFITNSWVNYNFPFCIRMIFNILHSLYINILISSYNKDDRIFFCCKYINPIVHIKI